ncbi:MAG: STAS-like domain-containing protein [Bacillota bacterium]|nr:STAS-like domain-containing protein [Bacillota bacterium]
MEAIRVTDIIGTNFGLEDAILLRDYVEKDLDDELILDFTGIYRIPTTFLCCMLTDLINKNGRDYVASHIHIRNLSNIADYRRVLLGTAFMDDSSLTSKVN